MNRGVFQFTMMLAKVCPTLVVLASCATPTSPPGDVWLIEEGSSCQRLTAGFPADLGALREIAGDHVLPVVGSRREKGLIQLEFTSCSDSVVGEGNSTGPLDFARVTIPLDPEGLPWTITGGTVSSWKSVALVVGSETGFAKGFHRQLSFTVLTGEVHLEINEHKGATKAVAIIHLTEGDVQMEAELTGEPDAFQQIEALVGARMPQSPPFLGPHAMNRMRVGKAKLRLHGITPLSDLDLPPATNEVALDTELHWRIGSWGRGVD